MRIIASLRRKSTLLKLIGFSVLIITVESCTKETDRDQQLDSTFDASNVAALSEDFEVRNAYFNVDSIEKFNFKEDVIFGEDTLTFDLLYSLGNGIDTETGSQKFGIFNINQPLDAIVKYSLNEFFAKKVIVSWDMQKNKHLVDSILTKILGEDSRVHDLSLESKYALDSCIYIDFLQVNKFGDVGIDYENQNMNDFLKYKSSNYEGLESDSITLTPQQFKSYYGDKYTSSMTLGTAIRFQFQIIRVDCSSGKEGAILIEAMDMIKKSINEEAKWEDLKRKSNYFKNSYVIGGDGFAIPYASVPWGFEDFVKVTTEIDSLYKQAHFGTLSTEYESFSKMYPKYIFIK